MVMLITRPPIKHIGKFEHAYWGGITNLEVPIVVGSLAADCDPYGVYADRVNGGAAKVFGVEFDIQFFLNPAKTLVDTSTSYIDWIVFYNVGGQQIPPDPFEPNISPLKNQILACGRIMLLGYFGTGDAPSNQAVEGVEKLRQMIKLPKMYSKFNLYDKLVFMAKSNIANDAIYTIGQYVFKEYNQI